MPIHFDDLLRTTGYTFTGGGKTILHRMEYDGEDRMAKKRLHSEDGGATSLQDIDYGYDSGGRMVSINNGTTLDGCAPALCPPLPTGGTSPDLFALSLGFDGLDVSDVAWSVRGNCALPHYSATYDALHRLKKATYSERAFDAAGNMTERNGLYDEEIVQYDELGNIKRLKRNGLLPDITPAFGVIDDLTYSYGGGRLGGVTEAASPEKGFLGSGGGYGYDTAGNMIRDDGKGLDIEYNLLNLPRRIFVAGKGKISFIYDAAGVKQRKVVRDEQDNILLRQKYIGNTEFRNDTLEAVYHDDGRLTPKEDGSWQHEYVLRDHLGNTRVMFADKDDNGAVDETEILQQNHYYPFGMNQEGSWGAPEHGNKYQYNGIEHNNDFGINVNMALFRTYDPALGRWWQIDPKGESFFAYSPYSGMGNSPFSVTDMLGDSLVIKGVTENSFKDLQQIVGKKNRGRLSYDKETGIVTFDTEGMKRNKKGEISHSGARLVSDLVGSEYKYLYANAESLEYRIGMPLITTGENGEKYGVVYEPLTMTTLKDAEAFPDIVYSISDYITGKNWLGEGVPNADPYHGVELPQKGIDGQVLVHPDIDVPGAERIDIVTHALREVYYRTDKNMGYREAHKAAGNGNFQEGIRVGSKTFYAKPKK